MVYVFHASSPESCLYAWTAPRTPYSPPAKPVTTRFLYTSGGDAAAVQPTAHGGDDVFRQLGLVLPLHRAIPGAQREDVSRTGRGTDIHDVADDDRRGFLGLDRAERADPSHAQPAHVLGVDLVQGAVARVRIVRAIYGPLFALLRACGQGPENQSHGQDASRQRTPDVTHGGVASLVVPHREQPRPRSQRFRPSAAACQGEPSQLLGIRELAAQN